MSNNEKRKTNKKKYPKSPTVPRHSNYPKTKPTNESRQPKKWSTTVNDHKIK